VTLVSVPSWLGNPHRHPENCEAPLSLGYAAAIAAAEGMKATILDLETGLFGAEETRQALHQDPPDVLVLSGITPAVATMLDLAATVRNASPETCIVAVGQHADAIPSSFLFPGSPVDLCAAGEYDETLRDLFRAVIMDESPRVPGTVFPGPDGPTHVKARPLVRDLDALPMPAHEFFLSPRYRYLHPMGTAVRRRWGFVQASRGCPHHCIYCSRALRQSFGSRWRVRSPASVVDEMRFLKQRGINTLVFTDDLFNGNRERVLELCEAIRSADLRMAWTAEGRVAPVDREMFRAMAAAGCRTFSMGVESGSEKVVGALDKRARIEQAEEAFRLAREAGLLRVAFFMVGSPGETEADFRQTRSLLRRLDPDMIQVAYFTCYPGSRAYEQYAADRDIPWSDFQHYEKLFNVSAESDQTVRRWQKTLYLDLLSNPRFVLRYLRTENVALMFNADVQVGLALQAFRTLFARQR
jgi:radical SAM superfamily enzyme YgiQ (UPF0313 family)